MWVYNPEDYSIQDVNESMIDLYGYSREQMLSFTLFDLRPEEEIPKLKKYLAQMDNEEVGDEGVWKHQKKNGEFIYSHVVTNPVLFEGEDHTYQLAMYKDITGELNTQLNNDMLFKHSLDGIMLTSPKGDILQANRAACEILGMTEKEITERGREGIVAKDGKLEQALKERSKTGKFAGELTYIHKEGHKIPVEVTTSVFKNYTGQKRTSLIFRDIRDRKAKEQALRYEEEFTRVLLSSMPGVFYVLDEQGKVVRTNEHSAEIFGLSREQIEGGLAENFIADDDKEKLPEEIQKVLEEGYGSLDMKVNTASGPAVYRFIKERLEQDNQTYVVGIGVDITKQKELQEQLEQSLMEKDTLLAEIHHRVKNNLAIVTSMMELQAMETDKKELQESLRVAQQRIQTIATIHELLYGAESLSHLNFGENVKQLVRNVEEIYNSSKQITIIINADPVPMNINQAIPCALLVNEVVTNAYKHAFENRKEGEIEVNLEEKDENVIVSVQDNGIGVPGDFMDKESSTVGITLINQLTKQLEGEITFSNENGTRFELTFQKTDVKGIGSGFIKN